MLTYEENVKAILKTHFAGFKEELIDSACNSILKLKQQPINDMVIDLLKLEIGKQEEWLAFAGYNEHNVDIVFNTLRFFLNEMR